MKMHPLTLRILHWINAGAMVVMIMSGWKIYNDEVLFGILHFPEAITLGVWAQHGLQWHFAFMWVLTINGLVYLLYGAFSGRFRRLLWPIRAREVVVEVIRALTFRLRHDDLTHYNAVQKLLYAGVIAVIVVQVVSGLAIWKPVQFASLVALFGDFQGARLAHFLGMTAICLFMAVHVTLALLVPRTILAMLTGGPRLAVSPVTPPASAGALDHVPDADLEPAALPPPVRREPAAAQDEAAGIPMPSGHHRLPGPHDDLQSTDVAAPDGPDPSAHRCDPASGRQLTDRSS